MKIQRFEMFDGIAFTEATPLDNGRFVEVDDVVKVVNAKLEVAALDIENALRGEKLLHTDRLKLAAQIRKLKEAA